MTHPVPCRLGPSNGTPDSSFGAAGVRTLVPLVLTGVLQLLGVAPTSAGIVLCQVRLHGPQQRLEARRPRARRHARPHASRDHAPLLSTAQWQGLHGTNHVLRPWRAKTTGGVLAIGRQDLTGGMVVAHVAATGTVDNPGTLMAGRATYVVRGAVSLAGGNVLVPGVDKLSAGRQFVVPLWSGVPDPAFGVDGWVFTTLGTPTEPVAVAFAVAPDGRMYIAAGPGPSCACLLPHGRPGRRLRRKDRARRRRPIQPGGGAPPLRRSCAVASLSASCSSPRRCWCHSLRHAEPCARKGKRAIPTAGRPPISSTDEAGEPHPIVPSSAAILVTRHACARRCARDPSTSALLRSRK